MSKAPNTDPFLAIGRRVLAAETGALDALGKSLDKSFANAISAILNASGRVVVTGMGKSGHIARKVAATFASTGTPSLFVHPAEASHGDMGMMAKGDVVLMLSNSGETPELSDVIAYTRRFDIPLIGVAGKADSTLLKESDVAILLPPVEEACEQGIVPTTSTTMTLALGDALAITLMEHREFTPENFREFHPGGKLGARLSRVGDLMHKGDELPLVTHDAEMSEVLIAISQKGFGVAGVTDKENALVGIITDGDLRRHMDGLLAQAAGDVMTSDPHVISADALAEEALNIMNRAKITCLFVIEEQQPIGILHIHDCLRMGIA